MYRLDAVLIARLLVIQVEDVITQVTRRDQLPAANRTAPYPKATEQDGVDSRITWKTKLRSLLCCLAPPQNDQYFRSNEAEAVVIRPPRAAVPPPRAPGDLALVVLPSAQTSAQHADSAVNIRHLGKEVTQFVKPACLPVLQASQLCLASLT